MSANAEREAAWADATAQGIEVVKEVRRSREPAPALEQEPPAPAVAPVIAPGMLAELRSAAAALDDAKQKALDWQLALDYLTMRARQAYGLRLGDVIDLKTGAVQRAPAP